jgi:hypothetical protein
MNLHAPLVPEHDADMHLVLCDFGRAGSAYVETDPSEADQATIVRNLLEGQYERPQQVIAFNSAEGWCRDVSEDIAGRVLQTAERDHRTLSEGTRDFVERQLGADSVPRALVDAE